MSCPICKRPTETGLRPFCSKRCADVDLAKWLTGSYAIASDDPEDIEKLVDELEKSRPITH